MKVSGFTFIRNAIRYDYPIVEAIQSILPVCDEVVVAVGNSDDDTLGLIHCIGSPKIRVIQTTWDESLREGGRVLALETDKAFDAVAADSDWAFYVQGDEVFHEKYLPTIEAAMRQWKDDPRVEALLFDHLNFYGSYDYVATARQWTKRDIRVIRNDKKIRSWKDASSFRSDGQKLRVKYVDACIYHYGWVKEPAAQAAKRKSFEKLWHSDQWIEQYVAKEDEFDYTRIDEVSHFTGTHPAVMQPRIKRVNWTFSFDPTKRQSLPLRRRLLNYIYRTFGLHIGEFRNYALLR